MGTLTVDNIVASSGVGKISQVVQTVKTDNFSTTSTTFVDVTGSVSYTHLRAHET